MTMKMMLVLFIVLLFFAGANIPYHNDVLMEAVLKSLNDLLRKLETIAGTGSHPQDDHKQPPAIRPDLTSGYP